MSAMRPTAFSDPMAICRPFTRQPMKNVILFSLCLCLCSPYSQAASQEYKRCIEWGVKFNYQCAKSEYEHHSKRLRKALSALIQLGNTNKSDIEKQHEKWLKYRNETCSKQIHNSSSFTYWQNCLAQLTEKRANEIEKIAKRR